mgnify:CR=1 FL=1
MDKKRYEVKYLDPETEEWVTEEVWFDDSPDLPANDAAEDYAYSRGDKGPYVVTEIVPKVRGK